MNITGAFAAGMAGNAGAMMPNTTGYPVSYNPYNQLQRSVMSADPMSQMGNIAHSLYGPDSRPIRGTDDKELHNVNPSGWTKDGQYYQFSPDPATMNNRHIAPPGAILNDSNIDPSRTPSDGWNQSSNLDSAKPNALHNMVRSIANAENTQFATENPGSKSQVQAALFKRLLT